MPTYNVIITRDITESTVVTVEAANPDDVHDAALKKLRGQVDTEWEVDDGSWINSDEYITDIWSDEEQINQ